MELYKCYKMEETMLKISEFGHNRHPSGVKLLAKNIRRGIREKGNKYCTSH